MTRVRSH